MNWAQWLDLCTASVDGAVFALGACTGATVLYLSAVLWSKKND